MFCLDPEDLSTIALEMLVHGRRSGYGYRNSLFSNAVLRTIEAGRTRRVHQAISSPRVMMITTSQIFSSTFEEVGLDFSEKGIPSSPTLCRLFHPQPEVGAIRQAQFLWHSAAWCSQL